MPELLSICYSQIVRALLLWIPAFVGAVACLGALLFLLSRSRFRRLAMARGRPVGRSRLWFAQGTLIATQIFLLPTTALVLAVPFALHRGAANVIASSSPRVLEWGMRTGSDAVRKKLAITDDDAIVDLGQMAPFLRNVPPVAARARGLLRHLSAVPQVVTNSYFAALKSVVDETAESDLRLTWDDLLKGVQSRFRAMWAGQARIITDFLRGASLHYLYVLAIVTGVVDLFCLLVVLVSSWCRGKPPTEAAVTS